MDGAVIDWTYAAPSLKYVLRKINNGGGSTRFADYAGYKSSSNNIYSVQENYLEVLDLKYYMPNELASDYVKKMDDAGRTIKRLPDGSIDVIQMLYEDFPDADGAAAVQPNIT